MASVAELNRVPEAFFVGVGEEEFPGLAAVGGFVEAGLVAGAGGHDDGGVFVEGLDAAEVEFFGSGRDVAGLPEVAAVFGAEDGAVGSAGPGYSATYVVDAAEAGGGVGVFDVELSVNFFCGEGCEEQKERCGAAIQDGDSVCWHWPPPPPSKVCQSPRNKVISFGLRCGYGTKVESPASAGLLLSLLIKL